LGVRRGGAINVEQQDAVVLDEDFQMQQVEENGRGADEDMREVGRVDLTEIARKKAVL
jgi:hypothetical protein